MKFTAQTALFVLTFFFLLFVLIYTLNEVTAKKANFKLDQDIKYVVFGHSHPACAFNDSLISNLRNLSDNGESYFYTYPKVKNIILQNPKIEAIFIEFTNNQIDAKLMDDWIWEDKRMSFRYPKYMPFIDGQDHLLLIEKNFTNFGNCLSVSVKEKASRILKNDFDYVDEIGGYNYLDRHKTDSLLKVRKPKINNKVVKTNPKLAHYNIKYLNKIIDFCKENNKKVFLIRSPQHKEYPKLNNENIYSEVKKKYFSTVELLDFNDFPLDNAAFGDLDHLNFKGAKVFSNWFDALLKEDLLNRQDKQDFIKRQM